MKNNGLFKMEEKTFNARRATFKLLCVIVTAIFLLFLDKPRQITYVVPWILFLNLYLVIATFSNFGALIVSVFLFLFDYSILCANYVFAIDSIFVSYAYTPEALVGVRILLVFTAVIVLFINDKSFFDGSMKLKTVSPGFFTREEEGSSFIAFGYLIILAFLLVFAYSRPTEEGERGSPSALYEYSVVIFIVGYYFFGNKKSYRICSSLLLFLFAIQNVIYGGRITALQLGIVFFLFLFNGKSIPWRIIIPVGVVGAVLFVAVGVQRGSFSLGVNGIIDSISTIFKDGATLDTAYSAYYTSLTFIMTEGFVSVGGRLNMFLKFCLSMILGGSKVPDSNLSEFTRQYYVHYFGGVLPVYGHFYLGFVGVVLFGVLTAVYFNCVLNAEKKKSGIIGCISVYFIATTPRWYLYSPTPLIRGVALLAVVYCATYFAERFLKRMRVNAGK